MPDQSLLTLLHNLNALRVIAKFYRLCYAAAKAGFNPNQPRVPAGSALGGRWVSALGSDKVRPASSAREGEVAPPFDTPACTMSI
jgi:hypothetical protein